MLKLTKKQKNSLKKIAKKYKLNFIVLFGSQAQGFVHSGSDFDFAYSSQAPLSYQKEFDFIKELVHIFQNPEIDLINLKDASPLLAKEVAFKGKLLVEIVPHSFAYFQMYAYKMFNEIKPLLILKDKFIVKNL